MTHVDQDLRAECAEMRASNPLHRMSFHTITDRSGHRFTVPKATGTTREQRAQGTAMALELIDAARAATDAHSSDPEAVGYILLRLVPRLSEQQAYAFFNTIGHCLNLGPSACTVALATQRWPAVYPAAYENLQQRFYERIEALEAAAPGVH